MACFYGHTRLKKRSQRSNVGKVTSYSFTGLEDQAAYQLAVRAVDALGYKSGWSYSDTITIGDYMPPTAPTTVTILPAGWTNNTSPMVSWQGITDANIQKAQYKIDNGAWTDIPAASGIASGSYSVNCASLADGEHIISIRGVDADGNVGGLKSAEYQLGTTAPEPARFFCYGVEDNKAIVYWNNILEVGSGLAKIQYKIGENGIYTDLITSGEMDESKITIDLPLNYAGEELFFRAVDKAGNAGFSWFQVPPEPALTKLGAYMSNSVYIAWEPVVPGLSYVIRRIPAVSAPAATEDGEEIGRTTGQIYWYDLEAEPNTSYCYAVQAITGIEESPLVWSEPLITGSGQLDEDFGEKEYTEFPTIEIGQNQGSVHPNSGNWKYSVTDVTTNSSVQPLQFTRTYNNQMPYAPDGVGCIVGTGWDHNYNIRLLPRGHNASETGIYLKTGDWALYYFLKNEDGSYQSPVGFQGTLSYDAENGQYTVLFKDKSSYLFNGQGQLLRMKDELQNTITMTYDERGRLSCVKNCIGDAITLTYNDNNKVASAAANGQTYYYTYGEGDTLLRTHIIVDGEQQTRETYTYDEGSNLTRITDAESNAYVLDYTSQGKLSSITDPENNQQTVAYATVNGNQQVTVTKNGRTEKSQYDSNLLLIRREINGRATSYTYDTRMNRTKVVNPDNTQTSYTYDSLDNLLSETNALGKTTNYTYVSGNPKPVTVSEPFNGSDRKITHYTYDSKGDKTRERVTKDGGQTWITTVYTYDAFHNVDTMVRDGEEIQYLYDALGTRIGVVAKGKTTG